MMGHFEDEVDGSKPQHPSKHHTHSMESADMLPPACSPPLSSSNSSPTGSVISRVWGSLLSLGQGKPASVGSASAQSTALVSSEVRGGAQTMSGGSSSHHSSSRTGRSALTPEETLQLAKAIASGAAAAALLYAVFRETRQPLWRLVQRAGTAARAMGRELASMGLSLTPNPVVVAAAAATAGTAASSYFGQQQPQQPLPPQPYLQQQQQPYQQQQSYQPGGATYGTQAQGGAVGVQAGQGGSQLSPELYAQQQQQFLAFQQTPQRRWQDIQEERKAVQAGRGR